ncbi:MAG: transaldolase family protein, partial [Thiobacillus sp.]
MNITKEVSRLGQSLWLDNLSRDLLRERTLAKMIAEDGVSGVTSNPSIFQNALATSPHYADDLVRLRREEADVERRYEALVVPDIRDACDLLLPLFERSAGNDGYVSLEVAPRLAYDKTHTIDEARRLSSLVARPNLLIKVPGTPDGIDAFETLT